MQLNKAHQINSGSQNFERIPIFDQRRKKKKANETNKLV